MTEKLTPQSPLGDYLSQNQLAEFIGCSVRGLQRLHARRCGPPRIKFGRNIFYEINDVTTWLNSMKEKTANCNSAKRNFK